VGDRIAFLHKGVFEWVGTMDEARDADHPQLRDFLKASSVVAAQPTR
jgi:ABC-type transporter Mla maintaining outer membrane lipid asymmetry ATPase subunit MlaF